MQTIRFHHIFFIGFIFHFLLVIKVDATPAAHETIDLWQGTKTCLQCHNAEAAALFNSIHYQWLGKTPDMRSGPDIQGKLDVGVNSYCINTTGNWNGCSACHVGLGKRPSSVMTQEQLENIDCMICHQEAYRRIKSNGEFIPDADRMSITMVQAARTVHKPTRTTCLQCHAKGGGGDNYKRGDMALAHSNTQDTDFDVHMAVTGGDLNCQECHTTDRHRIAGRGSDLRPTDLDVDIDCTDCHFGKKTATGHDEPEVNRHVARIACQTCHIPRYARNASDTTAAETTETHRDWTKPHKTTSGAIHPTPTMADNLIPKYAWWDGRSVSYLLFDDAVKNPVTDTIATSQPLGSVSGMTGRLFPFKYKTAYQPLVQGHNQLIALDTSVYFASGDTNAAIQSGLSNMGYSPDEPYTWVTTDTLQLITHEIPPADAALDCNKCHDGYDDDERQMNLKTDLGYGLKGQRSIVCTQCHGLEDGEDNPEYLWIHDEHVKDEQYDCSWCHRFSRPERNLHVSPNHSYLKETLSILKTLTAIPIPLSATVQDLTGDDRSGIEDALRLLK
jgi:hypothetical protein